MTEEQLNKSIARIILSTKRKSRQYSLFDIALDIHELKKARGLKAVSKLIGVSSGMLSQFLSVFKLPEPIIELVKERKIDSVSIVYNLSKFKTDDALQLAELLTANKLSSQDLKVLVPFRKQHTQGSIIELVEKIHLSKNIKVSVIRINKNDTSKSITELSAFFSNHVGKENVIDVVTNNNHIDIKLSKQGEIILRQKAKSNNGTFQNLISNLIN